MAKSDASTKILGFKYQEMVALLKCFEAKDFKSIYIECFGDVSDGTNSTEVKSSINSDKELYDTHIDFWKTLSNIIEEKEVFNDYSNLFLHTTAKVQKDSMFEKWAELKPADRYSKIIAVTPTDTIKPYYTKISTCDKTEVTKLLAKLSILDNQPNAGEFYKEKLLKCDTIVNSTEEKNREPIIERLLGHISAILINSGENNYKWKIDVENDFRQVFRQELKKYQIDDLIFPIIDIDPNTINEAEFKFIKSIKEIDYDAHIGSAMKDYLRAEGSRIEILKARNNLSENLDGFDEDIKEQFSELKISHVDKLKNETESDVKESSRRFYDECIKEIKNKKEIEGIKGIKDYYPKGRVHFNLESDQNLFWNLKSDESAGT